MNIFKHDVVSMYSSIMNSKQLFPIDEGEFINITLSEVNEMKNTFLSFNSEEYLKKHIY